MTRRRRRHLPAATAGSETGPFTDHELADQLRRQGLGRRVVERIACGLNHPRAMRCLVVLPGHADSIGTEAHNLALSRRRAEAVAREPIGQEGQRRPVMIEAYGKSRPIAPNENPGGTDNPARRARNGRVEAVIRN